MGKLSGVRNEDDKPILDKHDARSQPKGAFLRMAAFIVLCFLLLAAVVTIIYPLMPWGSPLGRFPFFHFAETAEQAAGALNAQTRIPAASTIDLWSTEAPVEEQTIVMVKTPLREAPASITPAPTLNIGRTALPTITPAPTAAEPIIQPTHLSNTYHPQPGSPLYIHLDKADGNGGGCDALYLVGQVFNDQSLPQKGLTILVEGEISSKPYQRKAETGGAPQYGPGGYEIMLASQPFESKNSLFAQVLDRQGTPLSPKVPFDTFPSCEKNLIVINFVQK